eukprot:scaffold191_cov273-Chaetoceros_neogracile.AAC.10
MELSNDGDLDGVEIFLFTDNSVSEAAFFNGSSKSRKLFELILELRVLEMKAGARGQLSEGAMRGLVMSSFIPLHQSANVEASGTDNKRSKNSKYKQHQLPTTGAVPFPKREDGKRITENGWEFHYNGWKNPGRTTVS